MTTLTLLDIQADHTHSSLDPVSFKATEGNTASLVL